MRLTVEMAAGDSIKNTLKKAMQLSAMYNAHGIYMQIEYMFNGTRVCVDHKGLIYALPIGSTQKDDRFYDAMERIHNEATNNG